MRLDLDIVRDTLLFLEDELQVVIEENTAKSESLNFYRVMLDVWENRKKRDKQETILYALRILSDGGLINRCVTVSAYGEWKTTDITDITFAGHEFLEFARNNTTWGKVKEITRQAGCYALSFVGQVAQGVVSGMVRP